MSLGKRNLGYRKKGVELVWGWLLGDHALTCSREGGRVNVQRFRFKGARPQQGVSSAPPSSRRWEAGSGPLF